MFFCSFHNLKHTFLVFFDRDDFYGDRVGDFGGVLVFLCLMVFFFSVLCMIFVGWLGRNRISEIFD